MIFVLGFGILWNRVNSILIVWVDGWRDIFLGNDCDKEGKKGIDFYFWLVGKWDVGGW